jgi:hypothetical protein
MDAALDAVQNHGVNLAVSETHKRHEPCVNTVHRHMLVCSWLPFAQPGVLGFCQVWASAESQLSLLQGYFAWSLMDK